MIRRKILPHYFSTDEMADLIGKPPALLERLLRSHRHPPYVWRRNWKRPRFGIETIGPWLKILDEIDLDSLPTNPPPMERPTEVFRESRKATAADVKLFLSLLPVKTQERFRRAG
jgi:hypothetical protein